jgi:hypothetical protein
MLIYVRTVTLPKHLNFDNNSVYKIYEYVFCLTNLNIRHREFRTTI